MDSKTQMISRRNFITNGLTAAGAAAILGNVENGFAKDSEKKPADLPGKQNVFEKDGANIFPLFLETNNTTVNRAFRIAIGDITTNILPYKGGLLGSPVPAIMAGIDYDTPWTRDASINVWSCGFMMPDVAKNTLLSVLDDSGDKLKIGGQYWDAIIWATGAWQYYLYTGDREFLKLALEAVKNSLTYFEQTEQDEKSLLFRGPACYGDGVAAYPDYYAQAGGGSGILDWPKFNPDKRSPKGVGIPMKTLSTNCLYYQAYLLADKMAGQLEQDRNDWTKKANALKASINKNFWLEQKGCFAYIADSPVNSDFQEGMGNSFAVLFGVADDVQRDKLFRNQHITAAGIPCVWPTFDRYKVTTDSYGRHSGVVWPHIQGFWAQAAANHGFTEKFEFELMRLSENAVRDMQFVEIYHPDKKTSYGGLQEQNGKIVTWNATNRQTWSATAYIRMITMGLAGIEFQTEGLTFSPCMPGSISHAVIKNLVFRDMNLNIRLQGSGKTIKSFSVNGKNRDKPFISAGLKGDVSVDIRVG